MTYSPRHALSDRIYSDFRDGTVTARTTLGELKRRYSSFLNGQRDPWPEYKRALRDYANEFGCLVLFDDARGLYVASFDCDPHATQDDWSVF
jgi:hypothetical protein